MRFVGTILRELSWELLWELPLKMGSKCGIFMPYPESYFQRKSMKKIPRCVIFKHLGIFTKVETEGLEPATSRM